MRFSVGIKRGALKDIENIRQQVPEPERPRIDLTFEYLVYIELRDDAHLKGEAYPNDPAFRKLARGPLEVFYQVRPLDDRYVEVFHFMRQEIDPES